MVSPEQLLAWRRPGIRTIVVYDHDDRCYKKIVQYSVCSGQDGLVSRWITYAPVVMTWQEIHSMRRSVSYPESGPTLVAYDGAEETFDLRDLVDGARADAEVLPLRNGETRAGVPDELVDWTSDPGSIHALVRRVGGVDLPPPLTLGVGRRPRVKQPGRLAVVDEGDDEVASLDARADFKWVVCEPGGAAGSQGGDVIETLPAGSIVGGDCGLAVSRGGNVLVEAVAVGDVNDVVGQLASRSASPLPVANLATEPRAADPSIPGEDELY